MRDPELRILRLHAPLRYLRLSADHAPGRPFPPREEASEGCEEAAVYDSEAVIRLAPEDGPRAAAALPAPLERGAGPFRPGPDAGDPMELAPGAYGFLQGRAAGEAEWLGLLEDFARQAWWEGMECRGPYILRRVREDGRWAAQVWRGLADTSGTP